MPDRSESSKRGRGAPARRAHNSTSDDVRQQIFKKHFDEGLSRVEIAALQQGAAGPQRSTIFTMIKQFWECGSWRVDDSRRSKLGPLNSASRRGQQEELMHRERRADAMPEAHVQAIRELVDAQPELYLDEIERDLLKLHSIVESQESIARACYSPECDGGIGYTLKVLERKALQRDVAERIAFLRKVRGGAVKYWHVVSSSLFSPAPLNLPSVNAPSASPVPSDVQLVPVQVCLDESHKSKDECRRRKGRARRGSPINISSLFQDSKSYTIVIPFNSNPAPLCCVPACLMFSLGYYVSPDAVHYQLAACNVNGFVCEACEIVDEIQTSDTFVRWVYMMLRPSLGNFRLGEANSVVLFDNDHKHWLDTSSPRP